ncbi:poly-gamma-glutamate system protein, partial [Acidobacteriota bacterium]
MFDVLKNSIFRTFTPIPKHDADRNHRKILFLFVISLFFFVWARFISPNSHQDLFNQMKKASQRMADAMAVLKDCRVSRGLDIDPLVDINRTGLIGEEFTILTTTIGQLEAKRTSTSPNFAGLLLYLLQEAGPLLPP